MDTDLLAWVFAAGAIILVGLVAAAEIALTTASRAKIRQLSETGNRRAAVIDDLLAESIQFWLVTMLLKSGGILVAGIAVGHLLIGVVGPVAYLGGVLLAWFVIASVQVICRALVLKHAEVVALWLAPVVKVVMTILSPLSWLLYRTGLLISGEEEEDGDESIFLSEDGLRLLMQMNDEEATMRESEKEMIASILEMEETVAREVMVPRIDMVALSVDTSLRDALDVIIEAGHSRIPIYEGNVDVIVGLLYAKDLLKCFQEQRDDVPIRELLRPAYYVPASKKVNSLFKEMQQQRVHIAMVVDEYGGIAGLVTVEDIIEEIVGEIQDEYDAEEELFSQPIGEHAFLLNSRLDIDTLGKLLDIDLSEEDADTLGGLIYSHLGHVPDQGETVDIAGWHFTVLALDGRRISQVRADKIISSTPGDEAGEVDQAKVAGRNSLLNTSSLSNS